MRKLKLLVLAIFVTTFSFAQSAGTDVGDGKNIIKLNITALFLKNISVQYERAVARKITVAGTFRYMPTGALPLKSTFIKIADDPDIERQLNNTKVGNTAFMPELRFYLGKKGAFRGFYLGPFASIAKYKADILFEYDNAGKTETIPLSGDVNTFTGGLMLGAQWKLSHRLYLDWWILGPNYGTSKGAITGKKTLDAAQQQALRDELAQLDVPLTKFTYNVDGNGATVDFKGPWAGVRSGICIGIRF